MSIPPHDLPFPPGSAAMKKILAVVIGLFLFINSAFALVNLNTASVQQLTTLNGVGPVKAKAIVDYRSKNGAFKSVDDLKKVPGFGDKTVAKLRKDITVGGGLATTSPAVKPPVQKKP